MIKISDKIHAYLDPETIEPQALAQLINIAGMPFVHPHMAVMPDCHLGMGATVGSVIPTRGAIIPAAVGVDIGCGMIAVKTKFKAEDLPENLREIREGIERRIPVSAGGYNNDKHISSRVGKLAEKMLPYYDEVDKNWRSQVGTLGSGNHFIELCLDETDTLWIVLHSGSRGVGNKLAMKHIKIAQKLTEERGDKLADRDLAYLQEHTPEFDSYIRDLLWAQDFALQNREEMMDRVLTELSYAFYKEGGHQAEIEVQRINCHHNFTQLEDHYGEKVWLTRKGAIQMQKGQLGVIPGSMGTHSFIVEGLANPDSFNSAPHGAGRRMSRSKAKESFTMQQLETAMKGIELKHSDAFIDEIPGAYKDIGIVMENSKELVRIKHELKQILNVKGN